MNRAERRAYKKANHIKTMAEINSITKTSEEEYSAIYTKVHEAMEKNVSFKLTEEEVADGLESSDELREARDNLIDSLTKKYISTKLREGKLEDLRSGNLPDLTSLTPEEQEAADLALMRQMAEE